MLNIKILLDWKVQTVQSDFRPYLRVAPNNFLGFYGAG